MSDEGSEGNQGGEGDQGANQGDQNQQAASTAVTSFYDNGNIHPDISKYVTEDTPHLEKFLTKYSGAEDPMKEFFKGIDNSQHMIGQKSERIQRPADDAPDHVKEAFKQEMQVINGTPATAEGYKFSERPEGLAESIPWDAKEMSAYADILHKHDIGAGAAAELKAMYEQQLSELPNTVLEEGQKFETEQVALLRAEHGGEAEKVKQRAIEAANLLGWHEETIKQVTYTAQGITDLANMRSLLDSDILPTGGKGDNLGGGNYLAQAQEAGSLATAALQKNDMAAYSKHSADQTKFNKLHVNAGGAV